MKSNLSIIWKIVAVVISVCCIAFMGYLHFTDNESRAETEAVVAEVNEGTRAEEKTQSVQAAEAKAAREKTDSFYQKLADGFNVKILVVGDTLASGYGSSGADQTWSALLAQELRKIYGIQVEMDNLALIDSDAYSAYSQIKMLDEKMEYDLCMSAQALMTVMRVLLIIMKRFSGQSEMSSKSAPLSLFSRTLRRIIHGRAISSGICLMYIKRLSRTRLLRQAKISIPM